MVKNPAAALASNMSVPFVGIAAPVNNTPSVPCARFPDLPIAIEFVGATVLLPNAIPPELAVALYPIATAPLPSDTVSDPAPMKTFLLF
jgi:hypothetical protein